MPGSEVGVPVEAGEVDGGHGVIGNEMRASAELTKERAQPLARRAHLLEGALHAELRAAALAQPRLETWAHLCHRAE